MPSIRGQVKGIDSRLKITLYGNAVVKMIHLMDERSLYYKKPLLLRWLRARTH